LRDPALVISFRLPVRIQTRTECAPITKRCARRRATMVLFSFARTCDTPASPLRRSLRTHGVLFLHPGRQSPINFDIVVAKSHKTTQLVSTSNHTANANSSPRSQPLDFLPWPSTARAAPSQPGRRCLPINSQEHASTPHCANAGRT